MAPRGTSGTPSRFEGVVGGHRVTGEYEGTGCQVAVEVGAGATTTRVVVGSGRVTVRVAKPPGEERPAVLPMPEPVTGNGWAAGRRAAKRTFRLDERGEIEDTTIVYLTDEELARLVPGPSGPVVPVTSRKLPFGVCVEYTTSRGRVVRTEWGKRFEGRRVA